MSKSFKARQLNRLEVIQRAVNLARRLGRPISRSLERRAYLREFVGNRGVVRCTERSMAGIEMVPARIDLEQLTPSHYKFLIKTMVGRD
jgi:hypothetical protein